jgi:AraC-like DNA-binding protein
VFARREVAGPRVVFILAWGAPIAVTDPRRPGAAPARVTSFVSGPFDSYVRTEFSGASRGIQLDLTPLAAGRLFGVPVGELANRVLGLDDLPGRWAAGLADRLAELRGWPERFATLDALLTARLAGAPEPDPRVAWAWSRLVGSGGRVGVAALAGELGWSRRHLARRVRRELGLPPKTLARIVRFSRAYATRGAAAGGWAGVAQACGYYDQAHLIRDVREFAGASPGELAGQLPFVQADRDPRTRC